ncbi:unnamed protein product [Camellia sinensis]
MGRDPSHPLCSMIGEEGGIRSHVIWPFELGLYICCPALYVVEHPTFLPPGRRRERKIGKGNLGIQIRILSIVDY